MATERIDIVVTQQGAVTVKKQIQDIGTASTQSAKGVDTLNALLKTVITAAGIQQLFKLSDAYTNIQNRLRLVSTSTTEAASTQAELLRQANSSYQSFEGLVQIYQRAATALIPLGKSTKDVLQFTDLLSKSVALSGVSASSAEAALIQLSQGLASGTLRGEELNSVLEQLPYVAKTIADGMGVAVGSLRGLAMQGSITPQIIVDAFKKMGTQINADMANVTVTISGAFQVFKNNLIDVVGTANQTTGIFNILAQAILFVANNLTILSYAVLPVIAAFTAIAANALLGYLITGFGLLSTAISAVSAAVVFLSVAILGNPLFLIGGAVVVGIAAVIALMYEFRDTFKPIVDWLDALYAKAIAVFNGIAEALKAVGWGEGKTLELSGLKAGGQLAGGLKKGGDDAAKAIGGPVKVFGDDANDLLAKLPKSLDDGGAMAGKQMSNGIQQGAQVAAKTIEESVTSGVASGLQGAWNGLGSVLDLFLTKFRNEQNATKADTALKTAQSFEAYANAEKARAEAQATRLGGGSSSSGAVSSSSSSSSRGNFAGGGSFKVGGSGGTDSQSVQFRATPNERVTVETPSQQKANDNNQNVPPVDARSTIINSFDPASLGAYLSTAAGKNVIRNVIQGDSATFKKILGS